MDLPRFPTSKTPKLGVGDRVRLHVVFMCTVHPSTSAVLAVVGDGRSGDPLHERGDKHSIITEV